MNIKWRDGRIFSLQLRDGRYGLLQMLGKNGQVAVFNHFRNNDDWNGVKLDSEDVLFVCYLIKNDLSRSKINFQKNLSAVKGLSIPDLTINISGGFRQLKLWEGSDEERSLMMMGDGNYGLYRTFRQHGQIKEEYTPITIEDYEKYKHLELSNLRGYPEFNERLYLCSILNRNFDPLKELAFNRPLDIKCKTYVDIIAGKVPISELGY